MIINHHVIPLGVKLIKVFIVFLGVVTNGFFLWIQRKTDTNEKATSSGQMLKWQAVSDLLITSTYVIIAVTSGLDVSNYPNPNVSCAICAFFYTSLRRVSSFIFAFVAHTRWTAVKAAQNLQKPRELNAKQIMAFSMLLSFALQGVVVGIFGADTNMLSTYCGNPRIHSLILGSITLFVAVYALSRYVSVRRTISRSEIKERSSAVLASKLLKRLLILYLVSECFMYIVILPRHLQTLATTGTLQGMEPATETKYNPETPSYNVAYLLFGFVNMSSQILNPVVCMTTMERYRDALKTTLHLSASNSQKTSSSSTPSPNDGTGAIEVSATESRA